MSCLNDWPHITCSHLDNVHLPTVQLRCHKVPREVITRLHYIGITCNLSEGVWQKVSVKAESSAWTFLFFAEGRNMCSATRIVLVLVLVVLAYYYWYYCSIRISLLASILRYMQQVIDTVVLLLIERDWHMDCFSVSFSMTLDLRLYNGDFWS